MTIFSNCDLEKELDLALPNYEKQLAIECYLKVGQPFLAIIYKSVDLFAEQGLPIIDGASMKITHQGEVYTLSKGIYSNPTNTKVYNIGTSFICSESYEEDFSILDRDGNGWIASATTQILKPILIDTLETVLTPDNPYKA